MSPSPTEQAHEQLRLRYRLAHAAALAYEEAGFDVIYQDNVIGNALDDVMKLFGNDLSGVVVLCPATDTVRKREALRAKSGYSHFTVDELQHKFAGTPRAGLWLDSSDQTVEETTAEVLRYIETLT